MRNIDQYYQNTKDSMPNKNVMQFINLKTKTGNAIELGCGSGRETKYLIQNGWNVLAIDREDVSGIIEEKLNGQEKEKFRFQKQEFENLKLEKNDLVLANFSLPFCNKNSFDKMWKTIEASILPEGYFVGNFFGINDEWAKTKTDMTFLEKGEVIKLFENFEIIEFKEFEKDGMTGMKTTKHWHIFNVIAKNY